MCHIRRGPAVYYLATFIRKNQCRARQLLAGCNILLTDVYLLLIRSIVHGNGSTLYHTLYHFKSDAFCLIIAVRCRDLGQGILAIRKIFDLLRIASGSPALHHFTILIGQNKFGARQLITGSDILLADVDLFLLRSIVHGDGSICCAVVHYEGDILGLLVSVRGRGLGQGISAVSKTNYNMRCIGGCPLFYNLTCSISDLQLCSRKFRKPGQTLFADNDFLVVTFRYIFPAPCLHTLVIEGNKSLFIAVERFLCMEVCSPGPEVGSKDVL